MVPPVPVFGAIITTSSCNQSSSPNTEYEETIKMSFSVNYIYIYI